MSGAKASEPLLASKTAKSPRNRNSSKPAPRRNAVMPAVEDVYKGLQNVSKPNNKERESGYVYLKDVMAATAAALRESYLDLMDSSQYKTLLKKSYLIKCLQAAEMLFARSNNISEMGDVLSEWHTVAGTLQKQCKAGADAEAETLSSLIGVFALLFLNTFDPSEPLQCYDDLSDAQIDSFVRDNTPWIRDWKEGVARGELQGTRLHAVQSWIRRMDSVNLDPDRMKERRQSGSADDYYQTVSRRVLAHYREFLSAVIGKLKSQLDAASTLQAKLLSMLTTGAITLANFAMHYYSTTEKAPANHTSPCI